MRTRPLALPLLAAALGLAAPAHAAPTAPASCTATAPKCFPWQFSAAGFDALPVSVPNLDATKAAYSGTLFSPPALPSGTTVPAVVLLHGAAGNERNLFYLARALANQGFIALTASTTANTGNNDAYIATEGAMVRFLSQRTSSDPAAQAVLAHVDPARLGASGHSEGARATSALQDPAFASLDGGWGAQVRAVVALDNLTKDLGGDSGSGLVRPNCTGATPRTGSRPVQPVVPALGIAQGGTAADCPLASQNPPSTKLDAFRSWVAAGRTTSEVVLDGTNHFSFAQLNLGTDQPADLRAVADLATSWFDRTLRAGSGPLCMNADAALSTRFSSAAYTAGASAVAVTSLPACAFDPASVPTS